MRAFVKTAAGYGHMATIDWPAPEAARGEAVVRILRSGLCGTDLLVHDGVYAGRNRPVCSPLIVGHEACGEVVALGSGVEGVSLGARVAIEAVSGCGVCFHCLRGHYNVCQDWHHIGLTKHGVLAEFAALPSSALIPLPDNVSDDAAAFLEPLATAVHTLERMRPEPGQTAAIIGPGPLGLLHLQLLQAAGAEPVLVVGRAGDEARLAVARSLGAETAIANGAEFIDHAMRLSNGVGLGLVVEAAGTTGAIQTALDIVAAEGTIATLGIVGKVEIDALSVMRKDLTWIGVVSSVRRHFAEAIRLIQVGKLHPELLITHRLDLKEAQEGLDALRSCKAVKVIFSPKN
jgi:2-desacetyl-2-hydroxyethyl bacteriochlorophyllide A dehydrogenase